MNLFPRFTPLGGVKEVGMYYTIIFWKRDLICIGNMMALGERRTIFLKSYDDTRDGREVMKYDIEDWKDEDPTCNGVTVLREE